MTRHATTKTVSSIQRTTEMVSAFVSRNHVAIGELPSLIASVHTAFLAAASGATPTEAEPMVDLPTPAQIRRSITPEVIISFIDGKGYKTLKRHLSKHGLSPAGYREKFGLSTDYPMTSVAYSEKRSSIALELGLGRGNVATTPQKSVGRPKKNS